MTAIESEAAAPAAPPPPAEAPPSPGALLRQARERAGLGAEDLAGQLKLAKGTLEALERDDFAALSEPVYVRGYYRKIAKVLPIAESELINAYNARIKPVSAAPAIRRLPLARGVAAGASRNARGPGVGLVVVGVIATVVLVALATREPPKRLAAPGGAPAPAAAAVATEPAPAPQEAAPTAQTSAAPAPATSEPAPATPVAAAATPAAAGVPNQLVLEFSQASFVRVEDSRGRVLNVGLIREGERRAFDGTPPYTVLLGTAHAVRVSFAGHPVDFSGQITDNGTARFTVP